MYKTKKEVDAHAQDVFNKSASEKERNLRCFAVARAYYGIREFYTSKRYLEMYIQSNPSDLNDAFKFMGDILSDMGEKAKALNYYKDSFELSKNRVVINRICDLLHSGVGLNETEETKKKWFDLQKSMSNSTPLSPWMTSTPTKSGSGVGIQAPIEHSLSGINSSPAIIGSRVSPANVGSPRPGPKFGGFNGVVNGNGFGEPQPQSSRSQPQIQTGNVNSSRMNKILASGSPDRVDIQARYLERHYDDVLTKLLEQNSKIFTQLRTLTEDFKDYRGMMDQKLSDISMNLNEYKTQGNQGSGQVMNPTTTNSSTMDMFNPETPPAVQKTPQSGPGRIVSQEKAQPKENELSTPQQTAPIVKPISELFKKPEGSWDCKECYVNNPITSFTCIACATLKPGCNPPPFPTPSVKPLVSNPAPAPKPVQEPPKPAFTFSLPIQPPTTSVDGKSQSVPFKGFTFGAPGTFNIETPVFGFGVTSGGGGFNKPQPEVPPAQTLEIGSRSRNKSENNDEEHAEEFVPTAEFTPVIPLPPLVEVKKGDEDENVIHEVRAKLFRFESSTKEWKERGIGNIKILQNKADSKKIRIVMWREQVQKVACNHFIKEGMTVSFHLNSKKAITWSAFDFSEGVPNTEVFVCRFAQETQCQEFKASLERVIKFLEDNAGGETLAKEVVNASLPKSGEQKTAEASTSNVNMRPISELFKKPEGSWECTSCYVNNQSSDIKCVACSSLKPGATPAASTQVPTQTEPPKPLFSFNFSSQPIPTTNNNSANTMLPTFQGFGTLGSGTSIFGTTATPLFTPQSQSTQGSPGTFNIQNPVFGFGMNKDGGIFNKPQQPEVSPAPTLETSSRSRNKSEHDEDVVDEFVPTIEFTPVIPLPPLVEVKKGDEDENVIHEVRAKLFRFESSTKEWKERGIGNIKILQNKADSKKVRVVMWREQVQKVACNHFITEGMTVSFHLNNKKAITWSAFDFSEGIPNTEIFVCRFAQEAQCKEFKCNLEKMIEVVNNASPGTPSEVSPKPGVSEVTEPSCPGCIGCDSDNFDFSKLDGRQLPTYAQQNMTPEELVAHSKVNIGSPPTPAHVDNVFKIPTTPVSGKSSSPFVVTDASKAPVKVTPDSMRVRREDSKTSSPFPRITLFPTSESNEEKVTSGKEESSQPNPFATLNLAATPSPAKDQVVPNPESQTKSLFQNPFERIGSTSTTGFGFGELAKQGAVSSAFGSGSGFGAFTGGFKGFEGAVTPVFGGSPNTSTSSPFKSPGSGLDASRNKSENHDEEHAEEFIPTAEFTPVIPLPPLVEVKKGDEDENVIHEVRAKLFRFESSTKEWKERGIGNIKILQNKADSKKIRIVMWREQVQKVACNHFIKEGMAVSFHLNNRKAITWSAFDFSEGVPSTEIFVCRFAHETQCQEFKTSLERMIKFLEDNPGGETLAKETVNTSPPMSEQQKTDETPPSNVNLKPISELFKKPEGSWECTSCYVSNQSSDINCVACSSPKPGAMATPPTAEPPKPVFSFSFTPQTTPTTNNNSANTMLPPFQGFGTPSSGTSIFGNTASPLFIAQSPGAEGEALGLSHNQSSEQSYEEVVPKPELTLGASALEGGGEGVGHDSDGEGTDDDDEDEEDEELPMFEGECRVYVRNGTDFVDLGGGIARVTYDGDMYCSRFFFTTEHDEVVIDHYVLAETTLDNTGELTFEWEALNETEEHKLTKCRVRAVFTNTNDFEHFSDRMADSIEMAAGAGVTEQYLLDEG